MPHPIKNSGMTQAYFHIHFNIAVSSPLFVKTPRKKEDER
jgi:hypothetical protein